MKVVCQTGEVVEIPYESLIGVKLDGLFLHRALLENQPMMKTSFIGTDLRGALLCRSDLSDTNFEEASLITAFLMNANLQRASLRKCRAIGCNFNFTDLRNADLDGADVWNASFDHARLQGSRLTCQRIETASFTGAEFDNDTIFLEGFDPKSRGMLKTNLAGNP